MRDTFNYERERSPAIILFHINYYFVNIVSVFAFYFLLSFSKGEKEREREGEGEAMKKQMRRR